MKKSAAAIISSLLVLGCAYPVFAAPKNVTQTQIPALRCKQ